jgi:hypothetical protein
MSSFGRCEGGGRRATARESAPLIAVFTTRTRSRAAILVDISPAGARLRGDFLPSEGEEIILTVERLHTFATVTWSLGDECGMTFDPPVPAEHIDPECCLAPKSARRLRNGQ